MVKANQSGDLSARAQSDGNSILGLLLSPLRLVLSLILWILNLLLVKPILWMATTRFRWVIVIPIVLPMSMVYSFFTRMRARIFFALYGSSPAQAEEKHQ